MAKSFKAKASNVGIVYNELLQNPEANKEQEALEAQEAQEAMKTQGRKGMKALRMSMAFSKPNSEYIRHMSSILGVRMTQFVNAIIAQAREHDEDYLIAKAAKEQLSESAKRRHDIVIEEFEKARKEEEE